MADRGDTVEFITGGEVQTGWAASIVSCGAGNSCNSGALKICLHWPQLPKRISHPPPNAR